MLRCCFQAPVASFSPELDVCAAQRSRIMKASLPVVRSFIAALLLACLLPHASGAATKEIVIGSVVPLSGPFASLGKPLAEGASACFDMVNANGGINGYQIRFEIQDDQFDPKQTVAKTQELIASQAPIAMLNTAGKLQNMALIESGVLQRANIALIGPRDGSSSVREMKSANHYFLIAGVAAEADTMVNVSAAIGRKNIVAVYTDDASGREALKQIELAASAHGSTVIQRYPVAPGSKSIPEIAKKVAADSAVQLVLVYGVTPVVAEFYKEVHRLRPGLAVTAFSETSHAAIVDLLGAEASRGLMLAQVTYPTSSALGVMKEFRAAMDMQQIPEIRINNLHLEGFLAARVVVEALKKMRGAPTREALIKVLDQFNRNTNIGGLAYDFSNGKRDGSAFVQIGIIGPQGKLMN
jgi:branched-chain amino acid transport system substrate-binding protein